MKFATLSNGMLDGQLILVSRDLEHATDASDIAPSLISVVQNWDALMPSLQERYDALNAGSNIKSIRFDPRHCAAPLPRSP